MSKSVETLGKEPLEALRLIGGELNFSEELFMELALDCTAIALVCIGAAIFFRKNRGAFPGGG